VVVVVASAAAGCANPFSRQSLDNFSLTYKINIQQGVVVTQEMADQLRTGMTRDQVRFVLGTPILTDPFHKDQWDYPFRFQPGRGTVESRRFTVYFDDDKLVRFNGDSLPTEEEFAASRHFATTRIVRGPLQPGRAAPPAVAVPTGPGETTVTPGRNPTPDRPSSPVDQTPSAPTNPAS
jgi:outer membrane protein assembly factor BamE